MHIFTVDVDTSEFAVVPKSTVSAEKLSKIHEDQKKKIKKQAWKGKFNSEYLFHEDKDLKSITRNCLGPYREEWKVAYKAYIDGDWSDAKEKFDAFLVTKPEDGTTKTVYSYMQNRNFTAPGDWKGFRALTSK